MHQALFLALRCNQIDMRIGSGYDVHRLVEGRDLIIGGVKIPFEKGLLGHSDADVLTHAIMDSLLGAAALGDIGKHFPDSDPKYKGASSLVLLERVKELLEENLYLIENIDATIIAQQPKMAPHIEAMRENISKVLGIELNQINIKATTEEGLGFTGEGQGISSNSMCLLTSVADYRYDERTRVFGEESSGGSSGGCSGCSGCSKNR
ncbi:MAG: 2C-methyl-D-erythritol 2,4-cyclodiphosphate synthase IspF [Anaerocolumna sp.]|nr:2C-methyl-D-erythritol 2,4-cyclodiphosphate synthase IspF [Anaerocolumna sp.]